MIVTKFKEMQMAVMAYLKCSPTLKLKSVKMQKGALSFE